MHRRYAGVGFIMVAAFLYVSRYIFVALFIKEGLLTSVFDHIYEQIGHGLTAWAAISLMVGVAYIIWGEAEELIKIFKKAGD